LKKQTNNKVLTWSIIVDLGVFLFGFIPLLGETLENKSIEVVISNTGQIKSIHDIHGKFCYSIESDFFSVVTNQGTFNSKVAKVLRVERSSGKVSYYYHLTPSRTINLEYFLRPEAAYVERSLTISEGNEPLTLLNIEYGKTTFSTSPQEVLVYNTFWNASTVAFLRWEKSGLFCGVENPFFKTQQNDKTVSFQYEPSLILKKNEAHCSDPQFIGVYTKDGKQISDYYPQTVVGNLPRYRNPDGHKPLDLNEIKTMQRFVADYMDVSLKEFKFINYHFFYPLPQMPAPNSPEEKTLMNVVKTFHDLGGDLFMFNPMYPYKRPNGTDTSYWQLGPEGSAAKYIMDEARSSDIGFGYYMGCARLGMEGNASALPFAPEKKDWKKCDELGDFATENCMGCDEFADWWFKVQNNTIEKYGLKLWSWDPGPGNGKFCYNEKHGHLPGKGDYKGWRNSSELIRRLKEKHPDLFLMAFYGRKEYGLWGFKYFDQHESYWELTVPFGSSIHPDLHADRINADGIRLQNWWNQNFRFMPSEINHVLVHRIQEGIWDVRLPKAWDHIGWKYSLMSGLACGGGIMTVILPDNLENVPGMKEFYAKWLKWGKDNFDLCKYNIPFGEQLRVGGVDGWARIHKGHGFIFLCNQNPRPSKIIFKLDDEIGLQDEGTFTLWECYPNEGGFFFDAKHPNGLFKRGETIECVVPAYQIVLMKLASANNKALVTIPSKEIFENYLSRQSTAPIRMLDNWATKNGEKFIFPFNKSVENLVLTTRFFADEKTHRILVANRPKNLSEFESLILEWKREYPDNFAWSRPDRLWLVLPSTNATKVHEPKLFVNKENVAVECHVIAGRPIIHYADISDFVLWNQENKIELQFGSIEQNQFLGPYLDYPEEETIVSGQEKSIICTLLPGLYTKFIVYDRPIDPDMPKCINKTEEQLNIIKSAKMTPDFFLSGQPVTISVKLSRSKEEIETVRISLPYSDVGMAYNKDNDEWDIQYTPLGREGLIMDVAFLRVWAVVKNGCVSESVDIPIKWHYAK
jgi:hypothetical protein